MKINKTLKANENASTVAFNSSDDSYDDVSPRMHLLSESSNVLSLLITNVMVVTFYFASLCFLSTCILSACKIRSLCK